MSRGRGGGRGRGGMTRSFNREQLTAMGVTGNEMQAPLVTQPPPLFPIMERRPISLPQSLETDYMLILRQDFVDHIQLSASYVKTPEPITNRPEQQIDKLVAQIPNTKEKYDWSLFPAELRPKLWAKRAKKQAVAKDVNVQERLNALEQLEQVKEGPVKESEAVEDEEQEQENDVEDEEMDDGTDYANNYFDNGEGYEDDDDNMDEGPIY